MYDIIPQYAKYIADSGFKSVLVGGTTGENVSLKLSDRKKLIDAWMKESNNMHIQVHVGGAAFPNVIELASYCQSVGVDSLLTLPELYFKPTNVDELVAYIEEVAKAAPRLPVFYYHNPNRSKVEIDMVAFVKAASERIPNFKGLKYVPTDLSEAAQILRVLRPDQDMFVASETIIAPAALLGIRSSMCTMYSLLPKLPQDILAAIDNNDIPRARALQEKLSLAVEACLAEGPSVPAMKAALEVITGFKMGPPSLPNRPLSSEAKQRIQAKLINLGLCS